MRTAAIVIARGGSKRLPGKNVRDFCGLPLVAWSIIQAQTSRLIDDVYLSTDDDEIEAIGREHGAEIIRRPDWPDANATAANRVFLHTLDVLEERGQWPDRFMGVLPTSPLRKPGDFDRIIEHHNHTGWHVYPLYRMRETIIYRDSGGIIAKSVLWDKGRNHLQGNSGMGNIVDSAWFRWYSNMLNDRYGDSDIALNVLGESEDGLPDSDSYYVECEQWQCIEVDTLAEFEFAEVAMEHYILKGRGAMVYWDYKRGENDERLEQAE